MKNGKFLMILCTFVICFNLSSCIDFRIDKGAIKSLDNVASLRKGMSPQMAMIRFSNLDFTEFKIDTLELRNVSILEYNKMIFHCDGNGFEERARIITIEVPFYLYFVDYKLEFWGFIEDFKLSTKKEIAKTGLILSNEKLKL